MDIVGLLIYSLSFGFIGGLLSFIYFEKKYKKVMELLKENFLSINHLYREIEELKNKRS